MVNETRRRQALLLLVSVVAIWSCTPKASHSASSIPASAVLAGDARVAAAPFGSATGARATADVSDSASASASRATGPTTTVESVGDWGITIELPRAAMSEHDDAAKRHSVHLASDVSVALQLVDAPAPSTLAEATKAWNTGIDVENLGEGITPNGILYALRSFEVREGFRGGAGRMVHHLKQVSRVYAILPLDATRHVACTGYVEHGATAASDPSLPAVRDVCLSMRRATSAAGQPARAPSP